MKLHNVTLLGIDCVEVSRLAKALDICSESIEFAQTKLLTSLQTDDVRKVEIGHIGSIEGYSDFCLRDLQRYVETDFVLLVQHDGFILNPDSWQEEFLAYDYIGAPMLGTEWFLSRFRLSAEYAGKSMVGNGGFCLRSKKFLETTAKLFEKGVFVNSNPEDVAYSVWYRKEMESEGVRFAPAELAKEFSIEGNINGGYQKQFGFHGLKWTDISQWIQENPQWGIAQKVITSEPLADKKE